MFKSLTKTSNNIIKNLKFCPIHSSLLYSTQPAITTETTKSEQHDKIVLKVEKMSKLKLKSRTKKPQRPPFVKNLFLGSFDTELLAYPQLEKDELEDLKTLIKPAEDVFSSEDIVQDNNYLNLIKDLRLTGLKVPELLNGKELSNTECCKIEESIFINSSIALSLINNEHFGIQALLKFGTDEQKSKYLPQFTDGKICSTICLNEGNISEPLSLKTEALLSNDRKYWILNGEKSFVINGASADLLIVFANSEIIGKKSGLKNKKLVPIIVERDFGGISYTPCNSMGIQESNLCNVKFENTHVPTENLLGDDSSAIIEKLLFELRLAIGTACIPLTKKILNQVIKYSCNTTVASVSLSETDYCFSKIGKITTWLYALESMTYFTSLLSDQYENQDCDIEAAITKVFASEFTHKAALEACDLMGIQTYVKNHNLNLLLTDAFSFKFFHESNDNLKNIIALLGLQHAGLKLNELVKRMRNPFYHCSYVIKKNWELRKQAMDNPKLKLNLKDYLHPSVSFGADCLEYSVLRLQFATETLLTRHGPEIVSQHMELKRLAECAIYIYAMTACLARTSRSYCIGLRNADLELILSVSYCLETRSKVQHLVNELISGRFANSDESYAKIAKQTLTSAKYFAEHPLERNF